MLGAGVLGNGDAYCQSRPGALPGQAAHTPAVDADVRAASPTQHGSAWDLVEAANRRRESLRPRLVLSVFIQLCGALEALHAAGLAHRDVKPHNLLLQRRGAAARAVLMDFGSVARSRVGVATRDQARELEEEAEVGRGGCGGW